MSEYWLTSRLEVAERRVLSLSEGLLDQAEEPLCGVMDRTQILTAVGYTIMLLQGQSDRRVAEERAEQRARAFGKDALVVSAECKGR